MSSEIYIYLEVERYLKQYLNYHFGDPVKLIRDSPESRTLKSLLIKRPYWIDETEPQEDEENDIYYVRVEIPYSKEKDPRLFNYLSPSSKKLLAEMLETIFLNNMITEMLELSNNPNISKTSIIYAYCENHGIDNIQDDKNFETIRQKYYRWRKKHFKESGIKLS